MKIVANQPGLPGYMQAATQLAPLPGQGSCLPLCSQQLGLIQVKEEGWTGFSKGWQGCSEGFPEGKAQGKSWGAALLAQGKPRPSWHFYLDLHFI